MRTKEMSILAETSMSLRNTREGETNMSLRDTRDGETRVSLKDTREEETSMTLRGTREESQHPSVTTNYSEGFNHDAKVLNKR